MPNSINPGYVELEYHSPDGGHNAQIPVNELDIDTGTPANTTILCWDTTTKNWRTMTSELVAVLKTRHPTFNTFDRATLWSKPTEDDLPMFVDSYALDVDGTVTSPGWTRAAQETITARDTAGYIAKIVSLDMASGDDWARQLDPTVAGVDNILDVWFDESNGWSSRAGNRPSVFVKATRTLNEKLRQAYGDT